MRRLRRTRWRREHGAARVRRVAQTARARLRRFRQGTLLAVAATGFVLLLLGAERSFATGALPSPAMLQEVAAPADTAVLAADTLPLAEDTIDSAGESVEQATGTLRQFATRAYALAPKIGIALAILFIAGVLAWALKTLLRALLRNWSRADAISALSSIAIWLVAVGAGLSVIAGDATALVGSVGLFGLALSWALQAPIESFTGWLLNSMRGYYRIGDRIEVGEVFGDVYRIDILTTTVWEAGGPDKSVQAAQPTGALITFPNSELLRSNIINYTRDFPHVWDEVTLGIANESDLAYTARVFEQVARRVVGEAMAQPAAHYRELLRRQGLDFDVAVEPQVFLSAADAWTNVTVRYLVSARERRIWSSRLVLALSEEAAKPEHRHRILIGYPRTQVQMLGNDELP